MDREHTGTAVTRRRFLQSGTLLAGSTLLGTAAGRTADWTVMTRNLYIGTGLDSVLELQAVGATCCQRADLRNEESLLDNRVDYVFSSGEFETLDSRRVGHRPKDRIEGLWPSDHAGVVAELRGP